MLFLQLKLMENRFKWILLEFFEDPLLKNYFIRCEIVWKAMQLDQQSIQFDEKMIQTVEKLIYFHQW